MSKHSYIYFVGLHLPREESAETFSFRVDKAWRQRCSQRFRNILDMIAKKARPIFFSFKRF